MGSVTNETGWSWGSEFEHHGKKRSQVFPKCGICSPLWWFRCPKTWNWDFGKIAQNWDEPSFVDCHRATGGIELCSTGCRSVSLPPATPSFFRHGSPVAFQAFQVPTVSMIEDSLMHPSDSCQLDDSCVSSIVEIKHLSCCFSSEAFRFWETFALIMRPNWWIFLFGRRSSSHSVGKQMSCKNHGLQKYT